jgi:RNA polymerase sigma-70 factor (ECF subfamily)
MGKSGDGTDQSAIQAVLSGDKEAYGELVRRHSPALVRAVWRITGSQADAEDVVQDAFLRAYRSLPRYESRAGFGTWMYRIAVRCALDRLEMRRGQQRSICDAVDPEAEEVQVADCAASPERLLLSAEIGALREEALSLLTATERTAFVLRHMEDCSIDEIGAALGIAPNAAKQAVFRAVRKMRRRLASLKVKV